MCGIVGVWHANGAEVPRALLKRMTDRIAYRGPDGEGQYTDGAVGLGHRRLAIIDLTPAGAQPMANETGSLVLTYNGEVYNFRELRQELERTHGCRFHSRTDSEVVLRAYEIWGEACVSKFNGMFAFAIWDRARRRLVLARDRYGIKPLYWYWARGILVFASEIKPILEHPQVPRALCHAALSEYFTFQNILSELTLFDGIRLLPPGCVLTFACDAGAAEPQLTRYWDYAVHDAPLALSEEECAERLHGLFVQAVGRQLVSDVPVGSYLSGGLDSGSIASVAVRHVPRLNTFTGGFDLSSASGLELGFDERPSAEMLANLLKTEHYEIVLHAGDMEWVLPTLISHLEDLRVGQSYPNYYVARLAGKFVKVVLSGIGGDELFGGYPWRYYRGLNSTGREGYLERYYAFWQRLVPDEDRAKLFNASTYRQVKEIHGFDVFRSVFNGMGMRNGFHSNEECVAASLYFELKTFLHGLLIVEDRLSMAHSLETRVPFLDNDLVDFALRIPVRYKLRHLDQTVYVDENLPGKRRLYEMQSSDGKAVLRRAMQRLIPAEILERAKQGFSAPDASWFRGDSIDYLNRLLRDPKARIYEYVTPAYVQGVLDEHCAGRVNRRLLIWSLLSFEWWLRTFLP